MSGNPRNTSIKRIGILTGGGDCPGLNAVIRAVTKAAIKHHGLEVIGIREGFLGLIENRMAPLDDEAVSGILTHGGTILGSNNKCDPQKLAFTQDDGTIAYRDVTEQCLDNLKNNGIDALVVIGGDGTMACASNFVNHGINCIGLPKTIDNDLVGTDVTFGFATAVNTATEAIDRVHTTAMSHHRAMVVEVMGRNAGWIALHAGIAGGADVILIPEIPYQMEAVCHAINTRRAEGKLFSILCVSEGAKPLGGEQVIRRMDPTSPEPVRLGGVGFVIAEQVEACTGVETRNTVLGYVQRGGSPVPEDRILGTQFGDHAVEILMAGERNRLVVMHGRTVTHIPLLDAVKGQRTVPIDHPLIAAARSVGTTFGDGKTFAAGD